MITPVDSLTAGQFFTTGRHAGQVIDVTRPRTDYPYTTPVTHWDIDYVTGPGDNEPVRRTRVAAGTMVETWD